MKSLKKALKNVNTFSVLSYPIIFLANNANIIQSRGAVIILTNIQYILPLINARDFHKSYRR